MAGLGKYKKGAAFTLKSGNKPTFVQMGSSPANMNNFGIGQGGSPYKNEGDDVTTTVDTEDKEEKNSKVNVSGKDATADENTKAGDSKEPTWKKALKVGTTLLSGGIQGVYGGKRETPKINWGKWSQEEVDESAAQRLLKEKPAPDASKAETTAEAEARRKKEAAAAATNVDNNNDNNNNNDNG